MVKVTSFGEFATIIDLYTSSPNMNSVVQLKSSCISNYKSKLNG